MVRCHVSLSDGLLVFDFPAKSGRRRFQAVAGADVLEMHQTWETFSINWHSLPYVHGPTIAPFRT